MARVTLGPILGDIRGTLGNAVYDNYKGVHIIRSLPTVTTNPQSAHQTLARVALATFVGAWKGLTLDQKDVWTQYASTLIKGKESDARMNRGGLVSLPRGPFTGYNAFIACNQNRYMYGVSGLTDILEDAPLGRDLPPPIKTLSVSKAGRELTVSWAYITPGANDNHIGIWIKSIDAGIHPQLIYTEAGDVDGDTIIDVVRRTSGSEVSLPNGVYQIQAVHVNQYGMCSQPSELLFIQLGGADVFTYFSARQSLVSLNNQVADIAWTEIDASALIPAGAHTAILAAEWTINVAGAAPSYFAARKDATQVGAAKAIIQPTLNAQGGVPFICPITSARKLEYMTDITAPLDYDLDIYLIGYIE